MPAAVSLRISADLGNLDAVRRFVRENAAGLRQNQDAIQALIQAVDESVTNIIVHGYRGQPGSIEITLEQTGGCLVIRLRDQAAPFDPTAVPSPDVMSPLEQRPLGGLGIHLARHLVDEMTYRQVPEGGNELTLVKRISEPRAGEG
jgi:serine/threonine-protein kinase RsbW